MNAPMLEIELKLIGKDAPISIVFTKVMKRFSYSLPLLLDLIEYYLDHVVLPYDFFGYSILIPAYFDVIFDLVLLKDCILNGVMSEVEAHD